MTATWSLQGSDLKSQPRDPREWPCVGARGQHGGVLTWAPPCGLVGVSGESMCDGRAPGTMVTGSCQVTPYTAFEKEGAGLRLHLSEWPPHAEVLSDQQGSQGHGRLCRACRRPETLLAQPRLGSRLPAHTQVQAPLPQGRREGSQFRIRALGLNLAGTLRCPAVSDPA